MAIEHNFINKFNQLKRYCELLRIEGMGRPKLIQGNTEASDAFHSYCAVCYEIKNWLKEDGQTDAEDYVNNSTYIKLAIAYHNIVKHRPEGDIDRRGNKLESGIVHVNFEVGPITTSSSKYIVKFNGIDYDASTIATQSLREWQEYYKNRNISHWKTGQNAFL